MRVYNTLTGRKEEFSPVIPGEVRMYVCGVTVYDRCHIGHARSSVIFDVIRRYLSWKGFSVTYVKNFTDVDDKIIVRARQEGEGWQSLAQKYIEEYNKDMKRLDVLPADVEPRATEHIAQIIDLVRRLVEKGYAYEKEGDVFYRVGRFPEYGKLSQQNPAGIMAGARVEVDEKKENPLDFALWKKSKEGEPAWESPWGLGRPGWHSECSAMALSYLGETLDIHGGGQDLIFPHHENEIAQCEAATGKEFVRYWIHNGFVTVNREKMSKSLGNFFTIAEIFEKCGSPPYNYPAEVTCEIVRYLLLSTHYRSPIDFSDTAMEAAHEGLNNFYLMFQKLDEMCEKKIPRGEVGQGEVSSLMKGFETRFEEAMDDDFNTPRALADLHRVRTEINAAIERGLVTEEAHTVRRLYISCGQVLGLFQVPPHNWITGRVFAHALAGDIEALVRKREEARKNKEWTKADRIREELEKRGVILEDLSDGTTRVRR